MIRGVETCSLGNFQAKIDFLKCLFYRILCLRPVRLRVSEQPQWTSAGTTSWEIEAGETVAVTKCLLTFFIYCSQPLVAILSLHFFFKLQLLLPQLISLLFYFSPSGHFSSCHKPSVFHFYFLPWKEQSLSTSKTEARCFFCVCQFKKLLGVFPKAASRSPPADLHHLQPRLEPPSKSLIDW